MNLYGCLPSVFYSSANPVVSYWTHAATLAGYPTSESIIASTGGCITGKKSQTPLELADVILKKRGVAIIRDSGSSDSPSSFRITARCLSPSKGETSPSTSKNSPHLLHANLRGQSQHSHLQDASRGYRKEFPSSSHLPFNGLTSLQALCDADVSSFARRSLATSAKSASPEGYKETLKFGINRILSDDFGKAKKDKENGSERRASFPEPVSSAFSLCPCSSPGCSAFSHSHAVCSYNRNLYPRAHHHLPSLSAVHALQPPNYPMNSSVDALPGPYSILTTEASSANQPKRKRSWSRAVFSNLQRKGLEKRFEVQKYVTKPDRRQLAAMLGLTDAQVKVWFQNRRMKWRHAQQQGDKDSQTLGQGAESPETNCDKASDLTQQKSNKTDESTEIDVDTGVPLSHQGQKVKSLCDIGMECDSCESPPESPSMSQKCSLEKIEDDSGIITVPSIELNGTLLCGRFKTRNRSDSSSDLECIEKPGQFMSCSASGDNGFGHNAAHATSCGLPSSLIGVRSLDDSIGRHTDSSSDEDSSHGVDSNMREDIDVES